MSEDRKPIERLFADDLIYPYQTESVCLSEDVKELESLLKSKEALLDQAVEVLNPLLSDLQGGEYQPQMETHLKPVTELLTEIKEKR